MSPVSPGMSDWLAKWGKMSSVNKQIVPSILYKMQHHRFLCWWWTSCWSCWSGQRFAFAVSLCGTTLSCSEHLWCPRKQHSWHLTETSDLGAASQIFSTCMLKSTFLLVCFWSGKYNGMFCKPFQNNVGLAKADTIPHNDKIWQICLTKPLWCSFIWALWNRFGKSEEIEYYRTHLVQCVLILSESPLCTLLF